MNKRTLSLAVLLALSAPSVLMAQEQTPMPPPPTPTQVPKPVVRPLTAEEQQFLTDEARMVRELRLLTLQAQIAEQQRRIEGQGGAADSASAPSLPPPQGIVRPGSIPRQPAVAPPPVAAPPAASTPTFQVVSVWGTDGNLIAEIAANGMRVPVRKGDKMPSGWTVLEVRRTGIVIGKGKARETLMVGG